MNKLKSLFLNLSAADLLVIVFLTLISITVTIFNNVIESWLTLVLINIFVTIFVLTIAYLDKHKHSSFWEHIHNWYLFPLVLLVFKEINQMIMPIRQADYDYLLIAIDRWMFGTDPTHVMYKIANPVLTEILQIAYNTFFFLPVILAVNFIIKKRTPELHFTVFMVVLGFFLSYIGYFIAPAIGPRFTLHDFASTSIELPGLFLTEFLREIVNTGESIPSGTLNPAAVVQRDVFPSGHTQMTLIVMYLSVKLKSNTKYFILPTGTLLIIATVYMRYHYVIDLIGGAVFMVITMFVGIRLYNWWMKKIRQPNFEYPKG